MDGKREIPPGYRRMTKEEFIERMQRDALKKRGELTEDRTEDAEREEKERAKRSRMEMHAYKEAMATKYIHRLHRKDRKAPVRGFF